MDMITLIGIILVLAFLWGIASSGRRTTSWLEHTYSETHQRPDTPPRRLSKRELGTMCREHLALPSDQVSREQVDHLLCNEELLPVGSLHPQLAAALPPHEIGMYRGKRILIQEDDEAGR